jgi:hypothetical protein
VVVVMMRVVIRSVMVMMVVAVIVVAVVPVVVGAVHGASPWDASIQRPSLRGGATSLP